MMIAWFESLTAIERFFAYVAIPSTLVLAIQTILLIFGLAGGGGGSGPHGRCELAGGDGRCIFGQTLGRRRALQAAETGTDGGRIPAQPDRRSPSPGGGAERLCSGAGGAGPGLSA